MKSYCKHLRLDRAHVQAAFTEWSEAEAGRKNLHRVTLEHGSPDALIDEIVSQIEGRSLQVPPIRRYNHLEPTNGKLREIGVQSVKQQVLDYVAVLALKPLLDARLGYYQVASVKGKGQKFAAQKIRSWSQKGGYWTHLDVRQCYPTVRHHVVDQLLSKRVRNPDVLYVCRFLLSTYREGLEIGSYFSLRMAQLVLSEAYHHVESLHKTRRGKTVALVAHQIWYMDDAVLLSADKRDLRSATRSLERYMRQTLGLTLKPWKISQVGDDEPIDLAGFVVRPGRTTLRSGIFLRARRAFQSFDKHPTPKGAARVCSYWGWLKHSDSKNFIHRTQAERIFNHARRMVAAEQRRKNNAHTIQHPDKPRNGRGAP